MFENKKKMYNTNKILFVLYIFCRNVLCTLYYNFLTYDQFLIDNCRL